MTTTATLTKDQIADLAIGILKTIAPEADFESLDANANIQEALDIDSFDFLNLLIGLDEALHISVPESDYGQVRTLNELARYLASRQ